jgi:hypothetical protein
MRAAKAEAWARRSAGFPARQARGQVLPRWSAAGSAGRIFMPAGTPTKWRTSWWRSATRTSCAPTSGLSSPRVLRHRGGVRAGLPREGAHRGAGRVSATSQARWDGPCGRSVRGGPCAAGPGRARGGRADRERTASSSGRHQRQASGSRRPTRGWRQRRLGIAEHAGIPGDIDGMLF